MARNNEEVDLSKVPYDEMLKYLKDRPDLVQSARPTVPQVEEPPEVAKVKPVVMEVKEGETFEEFVERSNEANKAHAEDINTVMASSTEAVKAEAKAKENEEVQLQVEAIKGKAEHWAEALPITESIWASGKFDTVEEAYRASLKAQGLKDKAFAETDKTPKETAKVRANSPTKSSIHPDESKSKHDSDRDLESHTATLETKDIAAEHLQAYLAKEGFSSSDLENIEDSPAKL